MNEFLTYLKEECLPGVWSKGVALSRNSKSIERVSNPDEKSEMKFKIQTTERMLAFQVTIWPKDNDSHCNCGSKIEPCHHVVAIALAVQNGILDLSAPAPKDEGAKLDYFWIYEPATPGKKPKLRLKRVLLVHGSPQELSGSLVGHLGGIQSGRINSPLPSVTAIDLKIDGLYANAKGPTWGEVLKAISELPPLRVEGNPSLTLLKSTAKIFRPKLILTNHSEHSILMTPEHFEQGMELDGGLGLRGDTVNEWISIPPFQTRVLHPTQFESFVNGEWPKLSEIFEIDVQTPRLPKKVSLEPQLILTMHKLGDDELSVTAAIEYPGLKRNQILEKDLEQERRLHLEAKEKWDLRIDQPVKWSVETALKARDSGFSGSHLDQIDQFLGNFFQNQGSSLEAALREKDALLRLLSLREKRPKNDPRLAGLLRALTPGEKLAPTTNAVVHPKLWEQLRDYQKIGVNWLQEKAATLQGAVLADDMGLGKTVQTLASLQAKALIIVPTSLLLNWKNEAARFRPDLRVQIYHGPNRTWDEQADVTLTTYALLRLEPKRFLDIAWKTVVLDEAHLIRNPETQAAIAATKLNAEFRVALTGTPIQNRVRDLYSLFQFVAPDFFESESDLDPKLTAPFFLRRTKNEVLKELPPKTYLEHWVELTDDERSLYDSIFAAAKKEILSRLDESETLSPFTLFEMLLRARQVCDHPGLIDPARWSNESSKLNEILDLTRELLEAGHSVLIYSQWTQFLNRLESEFKGKAPYLRLDGSTTNRGEVVEQFQNSSQPTVFLLSLHAGGVGLNLMKASHVIFCDPWWNPFVELQAEDRAYRMGQEKPVTIHRILVANTIEVQIRELQNQKRKLGDAVFENTDLTRFLS